MCYNCTMCNRCGKLDRMMAEWQKGRCCPVCGTPARDSSRTCAHCGAPLPPVAPAPPGESAL